MLLEELNLLPCGGALLGMRENWRTGVVMSDSGGLNDFLLVGVGGVFAGGDFYDASFVRGSRDLGPIVIGGVNSVFDISDKELREFFGAEPLTPMTRRVVLLQVEASGADDVGTSAAGDFGEFQDIAAST